MTTFIPGKDAPLEETIDLATSRLEQIGIEVKTSSWLNPTPHCWSVHIQSTRCPALYTNGKGTSRLACLASGLGEFFERLSTDFFFADYMLPSNDDSGAEKTFLFSPDETLFYPDTTEPTATFPIHNSDGKELLSNELRQLYNPDGELSFDNLLDNNLDLENKPIYTLPFVELNSGLSYHFPISILNNLYVSNGMAAGNNPTECYSQALSEIFERYVKNIVISEGIALPDVPPSYLDTLPNVQAILSSLTQQGFHVSVKDSSLGGRFPVICVLLFDTNSGGAFASFGCNCRLEIAIERTLTELLQGRTLNQLYSFQPPIHDMAMVAEPYNQENHFINSDGLLGWSMLKNSPDYIFHRWDFSGTTVDEFNRLHTIVQMEGLKIYKADYSHCGMHVCRLLVPHMSEIYPVDDLIWNNRNLGTKLRQSLLKMNSMCREKLEQLLSLLDTLDLDDNQLISHVAGLLFDQNNNWATVRIGEVKTLIHLALRDNRSSFDWCSWCIDFANLPEKRRKFYTLLQTLLGFTLQGESHSDYESYLSSLYSEEDIQKALRVLGGECRFFGLVFGDSWSDISDSHKELHSIYNRVQRVKQRAA